MHRRLAGLAFALALVLSLVIRPQSASAHQLCFPADKTPHCLNDPFSDYWETNGGLPVFGYPITTAANEVNAGLIGSISGIPTYMSPGLGTNKAFLLSTGAVEVYEQRVGTLQVTEPSVLGVQVAYAGYFTPLRLVDNGVIELTAT